MAPISRTLPFSTSGSSESCWERLKRWISSTKRIVRRPLIRRRTTAAEIALRTSATLEVTPESRTNSELLTRAMISARLVLPVPGGPERIIELKRSESIARRSSCPSPRRWDCPTYSSSERGLRRAASGISAPRSSADSSADTASLPISSRLNRLSSIPQLPILNNGIAGRTATNPTVEPDNICRTDPHHHFRRNPADERHNTPRPGVYVKADPRPAATLSSCSDRGNRDLTSGKLVFSLSCGIAETTPLFDALFPALCRYYSTEIRILK